MKRSASAPMRGPLRLGVVGLCHGHVEWLLDQSRTRRDFVLTGISEPRRAVFNRMARKYGLARSMWFPDAPAMLDATRPEAVSVMTATSEHLNAVRACAPRGIHALLEKPLATTVRDARAIARLARAHRVHVLTNFETSWYASLRQARKILGARGTGPLRKMVFRFGHQGPRELGCNPEFLEWLTDPVRNGGGAIADFGCYGTIVATWLMNGARPASIAASAATLKPRNYPRVDDDATIVLTYPGVTAVIMASWAWADGVKEIELHTESACITAGRWDALRVRRGDGAERGERAAPLPARVKDQWAYLRNVVRGRCPVDPLSSLEMNLVAVEIIEQARRAGALE